MVDGTGVATFACSTCLTTTVTFSDPGVCTLRLTASDGELSAYDDVVVTVNQPNRPPEADDQAVTTAEDVPLAITLTGSDPDNDPLDYFIETPPSFGALTGTPPDVVYAPTNDYHGADSFTFKANDGELDSAEATVSITVTPVNDPPVAEDVAVTNLEDTPVLVQMSGADVDGDDVTYEIVAPPSFGNLGAVSSNTVLYTPYPDNFGEDTFTYRVTDGELFSGTATVHVTTLPVNDPPVADPQSVSTDEDVPLAITLTGSDVDGDPLTFAVEDPPAHGALSGTPPDLLYTPEADYYGNDTFTFVLSDLSATSAPSAVAISVLSVNDAPVADAGEDQLIDFPSNTVLSGSATDDGTPGGTVDGSWSMVDGPGVVTFACPTCFVTSATFSDPGVYTLRLTVTDGELEGSDEMQVSVNATPVADAGPDLVIEYPNPATLAGSVSDDGLPPGVPPAAAWNQVSGPGVAVFGNANQAATTVEFSRIGDYTLRLSATDSRRMDSDTATVSVRPAGPNQPPAVTAGPDQAIGLTGETTLEGGISDDGLPSGMVDGSWLMVDGPGVVTFACPTCLTTTASFSDAGTYVLRLTAFDGELSAQDEVSITVYPANLPPAADAGADQSVTGAAAVLSGSVSDDGLPSGVVTVQWAQVSGPAQSAFGSPHSAVTPVTFPEQGTYVFRMVAGDGDLSSEDEVTVVVSGNRPPVVDAGPDQVLETVVAPDPEPPSYVVPPPPPDTWIYDAGQPGWVGLVRLPRLRHDK